MKLSKHKGSILAEVFSLHFAGCRKSAFTLAEVLITLGVIGIVAALTIPNLVGNYKRHKTSTKLKKFYNTMTQAIMRSEVDNGPALEWDKEDIALDENEQLARVQRFFNKYLAPYIIITKSEVSKTNTKMMLYYLPDGSVFKLNNGNCIHIMYYVNGSETNSVSGISRFDFLLCDKKYNSMHHALYPERAFGAYCDFQECSTRTKAIETCSSTPYYCSVLLEYDNWEFLKDYPHKF